MSLSALPLLSLPLHSLIKSDPVLSIFSQPVRSRSSCPPPPGPSGERERGLLLAVEVKIWQDLRYALDLDPNSTHDFCLRCLSPDCLNLTVPSAPLNSHITTNECLSPTTFPSFQHPSRLDHGYLGPLSETDSRNSCQLKRGHVPAVKSPGRRHHFSRQQNSVIYLVFFDTSALSHPALSSLPPASSRVTRGRPVDFLLRINCG